MKARHSWHGSRVAHSRKEPRAGLQGLPLGQPPSSNLRSHRHSRVMPPRHGITVHGQSRNDTHGDAALPPPRAHPWDERETTLQTPPPARRLLRWRDAPTAARTHTHNKSTARRGASARRAEHCRHCRPAEPAAREGGRLQLLTAPSPPPRRSRRGRCQSRRPRSTLRGRRRRGSRAGQPALVRPSASARGCTSSCRATPSPARTQPTRG
mmetsp:Transcript_13392/g.39154  ORF Transcript_13392/g.39154 Transcript_13392/m.39154 type:complete len:210 (-) Transcript_13392:1300-1929(-)